VTAAIPVLELPAVDVDALVKTYGKSVRALRGVSFRVDRGTVLALLGPNGAGKTTTIKILATLSRPDAGRATVAGIDVLDDPKGVRRVIGCVGQKDAVDLEATGRENLVLQGQLYGMAGADLRHRVDELLDRFRLTEAGARIARTYSGGMRRKLSVAMGLVHRPHVLFLDEPTTGLDPEARTGMWAEIQRLSADDGMSVLLTTHYLDEADHLADRVVIIDEGVVVTEGTPDQLKSELRGDAIQVELVSGASSEQALRALGALNGRLRDMTCIGRAIHARVDDGAGAVPGVLAALEHGGVAVAAVTVSRPSLDDVYLSHTGRAFHAVNEGDSR
jgi:ABC-2 type transport system ATP-binding protein